MQSLALIRAWRASVAGQGRLLCWERQGLRTSDIGEGSGGGGVWFDLVAELEVASWVGCPGGGYLLAYGGEGYGAAGALSGSRRMRR